MESGAADDSQAAAGEWVSQRWSELISEAQADLTKQWAPAAVERPESWDGYSLTRAALRARLSARIRERRQSSVLQDAPRRVVETAAHTSGHQPSPATAVQERRRIDNPPAPPTEGTPFVEVTLTDRRNHLLGRLDHVETRGSDVHVVDYKSLGGSAGGLVPEQTRNQLLFYAGLVEATWGLWPNLSVSRPGRDEEPVGYSPSEALDVRTEATAFRDLWNSSGAQEAAHAVAPNVARCSWCRYQAVCLPFREFFPADEFNTDGRRTRAHSLAAGTVLAAESPDGKTLRITIAQERDLTCSAGEVTIALLPGGLLVEAGDSITIARLDRGGGPSILRAVWNSLIHVVRELP